MKAPVKRNNNIMIITSPYGERVFNNQKQFHGGVDLRSVDFSTGQLQSIITTERCIILRHGTDDKDNDFVVVKPLISGYDEIKYIHIYFDRDVVHDGVTIEEDVHIGYTQIKGQSQAHHLHFETWKKINGSLQRVDPVFYFKENGIKYKFKGDNTIPGE